jgi:glycosyltransferase involved in cell wall biosynthesis
VIKQTILPLKWLIISDNSTDNTDKIVGSYLKKYSFIDFLRIENDGKRSFSSKATIFSQGYLQINKLPFEFIGNLDADLTFAPDYYEKIIQEMEKDTTIGISGGVIWDKKGDTFVRCISNLDHAPGAVQFFRRECFEKIGGYKKVSYGGTDSIAELYARMHGWKTKSFAYLPVYHHKPVGTGDSKKLLNIRYKEGQTEYNIGTHPLFAIVKVLRRIRESPFGIGSIIRLFAYFSLFLKKSPRDIPVNAVAFVHREQMDRLKKFICNFYLFKRTHTL